MEALAKKVRKKFREPFTLEAEETRKFIACLSEKLKRLVTRKSCYATKRLNWCVHGFLIDEVFCLKKKNL